MTCFFKPRARARFCGGGFNLFAVHVNGTIFVPFTCYFYTHHFFCNLLIEHYLFAVEHAREQKYEQTCIHDV